MTEQIIKTDNGCTFDRDAVWTAKDIFFDSVRPVIGMEGYFADRPSELCDAILSNNKYALDHWEENSCPFFIDKHHHYALFLPADRVQKPRLETKKIRPVKTWQELVGLSLEKPVHYADFAFAPSILLRNKSDHSNIFNLCITGTKLVDGELECLYLGGYAYYPPSLLTDYEIYSNKTNEWVVIGVPEDEKDEDEEYEDDEVSCLFDQHVGFNDEEDEEDE